MKIVLTILFIALLILIIQGMLSVGNARTENHKYRVLLKKTDFEIREYQPAILASVRMNAATYRETSSNGFRILAGYIYGQNQARKKIAMTSPVRMDMEETGNTMHFIMPAQYRMKDLPDPTNPNIQIQETPGEITASIRFAGYANDRIIGEKIKELKAILSEQGYTHTNQFTFLGYNPPYQAINRRNEVMVKLKNYQP